MKFRVGDKVRILKLPQYPIIGGMIGEIIEARFANNVQLCTIEVRTNPNTISQFWINTNCIELYVENTIFDKI